MSFHHLFIFVFHFGWLEPLSWFHTVQSRYFFITLKHLKGRLWCFWVNALKDKLDLFLLTIGIPSDWIVVDLLCQTEIGNIFESLIFLHLFDSGCKKGGYSLLSESILDWYLLFCIFRRWWGMLFGFKIFVDLFPEFLHLGSTLNNTSYEGRSDLGFVEVIRRQTH